MIVTEMMKVELLTIAASKKMKCSELIRMILGLMIYRIRGTKTRKNRRQKRYRLISKEAQRRVRFSFYAEDGVYQLVSNIESETDCWSKAAFLRKIFDIYIHYVSQNAEILFIKLAKQAENDYNAKLAALKNTSDKILVHHASISESDKVIVEYDGLLNPLCVMIK